MREGTNESAAGGIVTWPQGNQRPPHGPHGPPPPWQPPPGTSPQWQGSQPAAPSRGWWRRWWVAVASVGVILVLAAGVTTWLAWPETNGSPAANRGPFNSAVKNLASAQGVRYQSTAVGGAAGWDARVTSSDEAIGTFDVAGQKVGLLTVGGTTYLRSPSGLLPRVTTGSAKPADLRGKWVTGNPGSFGSVLSQLKSPEKLAAQLRGELDRTTRFPSSNDPGTTVNGTPALKVRTPSGELFVSMGAPHRVLRFVPGGWGSPRLPRPRLPRIVPATNDSPPVVGAAAPSASPSRSPSLTPSGPGEMDIDPMSAEDAADIYQDLADKASELTNSVDTSVDFQLRGGSGSLTCSAVGCTVIQGVTTSVTASGGATVKGGSVTAQLSASMTINGMPAGSCTGMGPLPLNGAGTISCTNPGAGPVFIQANETAKARARASARPGTIYRWTVNSRAATKVFARAQVNVDKVVQDLNNKRDSAHAAAGPFGTPRNEAVFWSGLGPKGPEIAAQYVARSGGTTLERTPGAQQLPRYNPDDPATAVVWSTASGSFARGASGHVRVLLGDSSPGSIWNTVELPALRANPLVTSITAIDPVTGATRILWRR